MDQSLIYRFPESEKIIMDQYDRVLEKWPVAYEEIFVPTNLGKTFVLVCGDKSAPPLFLLHGSGGNATNWASDIARYSSHFRVYAADIPGEPGKSDPTRGDWNSSVYAEWMEAVFNQLGLKKASVIGVSLGGWTAMKYRHASLLPAQTIGR